MTTKYTDAPRTRVMTPASLNNGVHENHSIGQTMAIAPKKGLFDDISIPQIIAGAAAAATSVALASKIGIAGSVIGAAVSSVITVVSSQVYRHFISASAQALKGTHAAVDYPAGAYEPVEFNAEEHLGGAATTQEMRQIAGRHDIVIGVPGQHADACLCIAAGKAAADEAKADDAGALGAALVNARVSHRTHGYSMVSWQTTSRMARMRRMVSSN